METIYMYKVDQVGRMFRGDLGGARRVLNWASQVGDLTSGMPAFVWEGGLLLKCDITVLMELD